MKFSAFHLKRYRQITSLLWKYGRTDLAQQMSSEEGFGVDVQAAAEGQPLTAGFITILIKKIRFPTKICAK